MDNSKTNIFIILKDKITFIIEENIYIFHGNFKNDLIWTLCDGKMYLE